MHGRWPLQLRVLQRRQEERQDALRLLAGGRRAASRLRQRQVQLRGGLRVVGKKALKRVWQDAGGCGTP